MASRRLCRLPISLGITAGAACILFGSAGDARAGASADGLAVGTVKAAATACPGIRPTAKASEIEHRWSTATDQAQRADYDLQFGLARDGFACAQKIIGITCGNQNLARCGKAIQLFGAKGWKQPGLLSVSAPSPYVADMPPAPAATKITTAADQEQETASAADEAFARKLSKLLGVGTNPGDIMNGAANVKPKPYSEIHVQYTIYRPATPTEILATAAEAAIKVGTFALAEKHDIKERRIRIQMAILANPKDSFIGTFVAVWTASAVLTAVAQKQDASTLVGSALIEEVYGSYWPALCSNLPRPEQFLSGGDEPEHPYDVENPQQRDLSCKRRTGREVRVGG
jgi:hypothetical protein